MMLFRGQYRLFFGAVGKWPSLILIFIQAILGPIGSIPRLITDSISLISFSIFISIFLFFIALRPQKMITFLGLILTPILLLSLGMILAIGLWNHPEQSFVDGTPEEALIQGLNVGYNTLDLIASFIFAPLVLTHFLVDGEDVESPQRAFKKMVKASLIAATLLSLMYIGLTYLPSYYTPLLDEGHRPEERLSLISMLLLGPKGAFVSCLAVALTCLTTALPLVRICADYIHKDLFQNKVGDKLPLALTLLLSGVIANLGFMGTAEMLGPILQILCPALIVLSLFNITHKLYETRVPKIPVFATLAISAIKHMV